MTMTKDEISELIKLVDNNQERIENVLHEDEDAAVMMIKQALTEYRDSLDKFDVLQHLRDGNSQVIDTETGDIYGTSSDLTLFHKDQDNDWSHKFNHECLTKALLQNKLQPYTPPVEDMLENGCVYWVKDTVTGVTQDTPYKWIDKHFIFPDGEGGYFDWPIDLFEPILRDGKPIKVEVPE